MTAHPLKLLLLSALLQIFLCLTPAPARADSWYVPANDNIEIRRVVALEDFRLQGLREADPDRWQALSGTGKQEYMAAPEPVAQAADIEAVRIKPPQKPGGAEVTLLFKEESWARLRDQSARYIAHQLALVTSGKVIAATTIEEAFSLQLTFSGVAKQDAAQLAENFTAQPTFDLARAEERYSRWLVARAAGGATPAERLYIAGELLGRKQPEQALPILEALAESPNEHVARNALSLLGKTLLSLKEYDRASRFYERLMQSRPGLWKLKKELAAVRAAQKRYEEAHRLLSEYVELEELSGTTCELERQLDLLKTSDATAAQKKKLRSQLERQITHNRKRIERGK